MKRINLLVLLISLIANSSFAQVSNHKIIGVWQVDSPNLADAWLSNYRFFKDGTFKYTFNQYDDRGRIREAKGTYTLKDGTLTVIIKTRTEFIGGDLVGGGAGFQKEELVLDGGKPIEVKQKIIEPIVFNIEWFIKKGVRGFKIQNNTYYLISTDPHKEEN
jgi:hypothetical protein